MNELLNLFASGSSGSPAGLPFVDLVLRLLIAFLAGMSVAWVYRLSHGSLNYSQNFVQALVLLSLIVSVIMGVVGDSLARAFGLGAALAIVRFRTPIKDALDTAFLFLSVAVGMAAGVGAGVLALSSAAAIGAVAIFLSWISFGAPTRAEGLLRFRTSLNTQDRELISEIVGRHAASFRLSGMRSVTADEDELIYDLDLRSEESAAVLVKELKQLGLEAVSLLPSARVQGG